MTPREIDEVVCSWRAACLRREELRLAISEHLSGGTMSFEARADWIVQTVDELHGLLSCPNELAVAAVEAAARRKVVTSGELRSDRHALMAGVDAMVGPLTEECTMAWRRACGLFGDIIAGLIFNPFRAGEEKSPNRPSPFLCWCLHTDRPSRQP
jgi:hypothetical protein